MINTVEGGGWGPGIGDWGLGTGEKSETNSNFRRF